MIKRQPLLHRIRAFFRKPDSVIHPKHLKYKWFILGNVMLGTFMAVLDGTVVNTGLPKIMASFGTGLDKVQWIITAYMLAMAVMLPTSGWLADRFGYKRMYSLGLSGFTIGSFLCSISPNEDILIVSRIIQGLGAGTLQPLGMAIITREFPVKQRGLALGFWGIAAAASISFGPTLGGFIIDNFSWPLIFGINIPVGIIAILFTIVIQSEYKHPAKRKFDLIGFISITIFLPLTLFALSETTAATNTAGWHAPYILLCAAIALIALTVFITAELTAEDPIIDLRLVLNHNFGLALIILVFFSIGMFGSTFLFPVYLQNSLGYTALEAGAVFIPVGIIQGIVAPISGRISDRINPKIPIIIGILLMSFSFYLNSKLSYLSEIRSIMVSLYLRGFGMGLTFTALNTVALLEIPRAKMAQASGISNSIRQLGGSLGVALLATMLTVRTIYHNQQFGTALNARSQAYNVTTDRLRFHLQHNAGIPPVKVESAASSLILSNLNKQAYIEGINDDFLLSGIFTLIGGIPIFFIRTKKSNAHKNFTQE
ncbi:MAG: DHA2 family efflux MFS transporter permease subunit [Bacteroidales bacterium]|nr:DHA2 family efflux MFS transporter permease subunit [Bacteroidales bacterium]HPM17522.1 DHA2 family efflux MFS transporter permease subunit [Bacteroidales bacterium]